MENFSNLKANIRKFNSLNDKIFFLTTLIFVLFIIAFILGLYLLELLLFVIQIIWWLVSYSLRKKYIKNILILSQIFVKDHKINPSSDSSLYNNFFNGSYRKNYQIVSVLNNVNNEEDFIKLFKYWANQSNLDDFNNDLKFLLRNKNHIDVIDRFITSKNI